MSVLTQVLLVPRQSLWTDPPVLVLQEAQLCRVVAFRFFPFRMRGARFEMPGLRVLCAVTFKIYVAGIS